MFARHDVLVADAGNSARRGHTRLGCDRPFLRVPSHAPTADAPRQRDPAFGGARSAPSSGAGGDGPGRRMSPVSSRDGSRPGPAGSRRVVGRRPAARRHLPSGVADGSCPATDRHARGVTFVTSPPRRGAENGWWGCADGRRSHGRPRWVDRRPRRLARGRRTIISRMLPILGCIPRWGIVPSKSTVP